MDYYWCFLGGFLVGSIVTPLFLKNRIEKMYEKGRKELSDHAERCRKEMEDYANILRRR